MNHLLREAEDGLVNAVNSFSKLRDVFGNFDVSVYPVCDNHGAGFMKYGVSGSTGLYCPQCSWTYKE